MSQSASPISILICDDDKSFSLLLTEFLQPYSDLHVVGIVHSKRELMELLAENAACADVLLLDMCLREEGLGGLDILMELQQVAPQLKTIVLSSFDEEETVVHALSFGKAMNYIPKRHYRDLPASIRQVVHHGSGLHPSAASRVLQHLSASGKQQIRRKVTDRQLAILRMLDQGMNRRDIAAALFYTEQSINNELCKVSTLLKGTFPYLQWLRLKKHNTAEILQLARQLEILP
ncbi:hypothetical protein B1A99_32270 [Cohnella sp. CIP 111063]|jgi:two-component system response regulator DevR|uniref:response regulator transcription factor n=1 Tax=unclassified Cohnella TaxID=2636738 RepID=UPI000B8BB634|nr:MULTISPECIES: response regulator transcription factor [unclassified Cohnella]OXS52871.1 hypothetical protein B1A99_32270 [Cohnella sp. CIP 111063]PRX59844.1 DNA-binding NarL/FixJ family response regulator [Cohnella sp. SGD-V74]